MQSAFAALEPWGWMGDVLGLRSAHSGGSPSATPSTCKAAMKTLMLFSDLATEDAVARSVNAEGVEVGASHAARCA